MALGLAWLVVFLGSAWLGYGPGILVALVTLLEGPHLLVINQGRIPTSRPETLRVMLLMVVSLLLSYAGRSHRQSESELRRQAENLTGRIRERTDQLLVSALEKRQAEDRLHFVLDSADVGYWDYDIASGASTRSPTHDQVFGYDQPLPHWDYRTFLRHVHPDDRDGVEREARASMAERNRSLEFRIVWPDGSVHWVWARVQMHPGPTGEPAHIGGVVMDITARRRAEEDLRDQAQLLDLAHDAILTLDRQGRIRFWSRGAERMYGYARQEALGNIAHELLKTNFPDSLEAIERTAAEHGHWEGEFTQTRKDGSQLVVASRWVLWVGANGETLGFLEISSDITERRRIEQQLLRAQKLESLGVLAGGVAHDFNNLLTGILGNASLALDGLAEDDPNRALIKEVTHAAERAADLTRQLLAYAGKGRFVMRNFSLSALVKEIAGLVQTSIPEGVQLRLQLDDAAPEIFADPGQVQQIVMNLVINAAEAIGPEGGTVTVRTGAETVNEQYIATMPDAGDPFQPGDYAMLEVEDTGCGMTQETMKNIFDPFFTTKFAGRGLGLSAVLGIVQAHKGALRVASQPAHGTTFKLLFPISSQTPTTLVTAPVEDLKGSGTILLVDDEEVVLRAAKNALERYGYRILPAGDGRQAVEIYRRDEGISLVLLDLTMPVMSGEETLRQLQFINPAVRVLLTSGFSEAEAVKRFAGGRLAGFIQKPYTAAALAKRVKEAIEA
jgi:PAS domain S-box-containing protein